MTEIYKNWRIAEDEHQILWLTLDRAGASTNALSHEVMSEFNLILDALKTQSCKGLVIVSGKQNGFIAGANIEEFANIKTLEEATEAAQYGQRVFRKLSELPFPTLALISGFCLGGGLELALGCTYRVAEDSLSTRLGLPEVMLGLSPGWTGVVRLPRQIGAPQAMQLILSGSPVGARAAEKMGLVDACVPSRHLRRAAVQILLERSKPKTLPWYLKALELSFVRPLFSTVLTRQVQKRARADHYPSPFAMIEDWKLYGSDSDVAYQKSAETFGRLFMTDASKNLIRVFHLQERLKGLARGLRFKANWVHVVGAGTMGGDIAAWCALQGIKVTLQDREPKFVAKAIKRAHDLFKKKLKKPRAIQSVMDNLIPDVKQDGISKADVIIEAIFENLEAKQTLFKAIEQRAKPGAILASNTSSIPLSEIAMVLKEPGRLVGIHFFNPVAKMPLVEIVHDQKTSEETKNNAIAFVKQINRFPLPVKSSPGFLVNRVLMPYLMEAVVMVEEGIAAEKIDEAAKHFGMPLGPIELADMVGLDVCYEVAKNLVQHFGGVVPSRLQAIVSKGHFGLKTGQGFYPFVRGKPVKKSVSLENPLRLQIAERLILRMVNEALACLREGIIEDADLLDAGMIFGTGFAPFRGGPIHYIKTAGVSGFQQKMTDFEKQYGDRFKLDAGLGEI